MGNKALDYTALTIALIGAVNWGLVGFFNFNLVSWIFGTASWVTRIIYALVGLCGLHFTHIQAERHRKNRTGQGHWGSCLFLSADAVSCRPPSPFSF